MSTVNSVTNLPTATNAAQSALSKSIGKDEFLKMLLTQLRNQDPLSPMSGTEFASQLAQFSSVEQLSQINENLTSSLDSNTMLTQSINNALATTFIGKEVRAQTDTFKYDGKGDVTLGYKLPENADSVSIKIYDGSGRLVRTIDGDTAKGENAYIWNGKDDLGTLVNSGTYTFKVEAKNESGAALTVQQYISGIVTGVRFKSDGTVFIVDGIEVPLGNVIEISKG
jgi:flagellar basal-body rod modification protein FlgD